ncbi:MAG: hypothetical protein AAF489_03055 [Bacteroidota bacterium]
MKKTVFILIGCALLLFGCSSDDVYTPEGGDILVEYTMAIDKSDGIRHTFKDNGTKFDKIFDANGNVDTEYIYNANDQLITINSDIRNPGGTVLGLEKTEYEYEGDAIIKLTVSRIMPNATFTKVREFEIEGNTMFVRTGDYPQGLYKEKYEFNDQGHIVEIVFIGSSATQGFYNYDAQKFEYNQSNSVVRSEFVTGFYSEETQTFGESGTGIFERFKYYENNPNPFKEATREIYKNYIIAPNAFKKGLFGDGAHAIFFEKFPSDYIYAGDTSNTHYFFRDGNIIFQQNGLPKSGFRAVAGIPFEFTYAE